MLKKVREKIQKNLKDKNEGVNGCLVPGERLVAGSAAGRSGSTDEGLKNKKQGIIKARAGTKKVSKRRGDQTSGVKS